MNYKFYYQCKNIDQNDIIVHMPNGAPCAKEAELKNGTGKYCFDGECMEEEMLNN